MTRSRRERRTPERIAFGAALKLLRIRTGRKQHEAAVAANITKAMLSGYETGLSNPTMQSLRSILHALGADFRDLQDSIDVFTGQKGAKISGGEGPRELAPSRPDQLHREQQIGKAVLAIVVLVRAKVE